MKKKYITIVLLAAATAAGITSCSRQEPAAAAPGIQTTCPVMPGEKINPNLYADVNGKRIYVCCPGCMVKVKADPAKYIAQLEVEGVVLEETPAAE